MKTHNRILFHCLGCGRVVHAEPDENIPNCCGKQMTRAAAETVVEGEKDVATPTADDAARAKIRQVPR